MKKLTPKKKEKIISNLAKTKEKLIKESYKYTFKDFLYGALIALVLSALSIIPVIFLGSDKISTALKGGIMGGLIVLSIATGLLTTYFYQRYFYKRLFNNETFLTIYHGFEKYEKRNFEE